MVPGDDIAVFNFTITQVPGLIKEFCEKVGKAPAEYEALVLHQANTMVLKNVAKRVGMPFEKCPISIDRYGNTSSASIPVTIADKFGRDESGEEIELLTCGFGIGLSWGAADFRIAPENIYPIIQTDEKYDDGIDYQD